MADLSKKKCVPCTVGTPALKGEDLRSYLAQLNNGWKVIDEHHLEKEYTFKDFKSALDLTNDIGKIAEEEGHHPDIFLSYGKVKVQLWTHKIKGLSESDFILAAKCDVCYLSRFGKS
ncbi:MAG: 4a-hydroxytetrahydrobiopterin dehydratase [Chlamydiae bacterium]|nr:4a-hydroxytetrahydrobiopterin dehydratase [Chlamydiota bacterium]